MKNFIGIEIGKVTVKAVLGQAGGMQQRVIDVVARVLDAEDDTAVSALLTEIFSGWKMKPRNAILSLPRNMVTVRNLHLPSTDASEMDRMIDLHLGRIVPYKKEEVVYTYTMAGSDSMGYSRVILAIAYCDVIKRQMKLLDKVGILPERIVLSSCGVYSQVASQYKSDIRQMPIFVILDVDADFTDFIVADKQQMYFTRSIAVKASTLDTDEGRTRLIGQVRQSLVIFNNEEIHDKPAMLYLSGLKPQGLAQALQSELDIPLTSVPRPAGEVLDLKSGAASVTAVARIAVDGLKQKFSFDIPEIQAQKSIREKIRELTILGVAGSYLVGLLCLLFVARLYTQDGYRKALIEESSRIEQDVGVMGRELDRIMLVKELLQQRNIPLFLLNRLQESVPETVAVTQISMDNGGKVVLRGEARESSDVFTFVNILDQQEYFGQTTANYTRKRRIKDREVTDFEVTFMLLLGTGGGS